jgi:hypothetical protein
MASHSQVVEIGEFDDYLNSNSDTKVYATNTGVGWVVDSGATRHFSGYMNDFESIKR